MSEPLSIALVSPHAWPARDDLARHVEAEAAALARRGHRVTVLAPGVGRDRLDAGRARLRRLLDGDREALLAAPGTFEAVAVGRALPGGAGRRVAGPFDLGQNLETALSLTPFDVVHLHEPLAPSPALTAVRAAGGVLVASFHRSGPLAGVAFLRPLVDRALARADLRIATSQSARRALEELLPGEYALVPRGTDRSLHRPPAAEPDGPAGLVVIARERDRAGVRFALRVLRAVDRRLLGQVVVLGSNDAPWRTRAAVPKAFRDWLTVIADEGPHSRADAFARARIALVATPEDVAGPALPDAMASGLAILAPRCPELEDHVVHGREGLALAPFTRDVWAEAIAELAAQPERRAEMGAAAARRATRTWDDVAEELERAYRAALAARVDGPAEAPAPAPAERILADLRVRPLPDVPAQAIVDACTLRGLGAVAVCAPGGIEPALAVAEAAPPALTVVVGQEIATADGIVVGLFLRESVPDGLPLPAALERVHDQGGIVLVPHPGSLPAPPAEVLRANAAGIDCHELVCAAVPSPPITDDAARLAQRLGLLASAGSGAATAEDVGGALVRLRRFDGPQELLSALADAEVLRRRRGLLARQPRRQRRPRRRPERA